MITFCKDYAVITPIRSPLLSANANMTSTMSTGNDLLMYVHNLTVLLLIV